jgi:hypothetical protein
MTKSDTMTKVRITDQFRSGQSMVYQLRCEGIRLKISISFSREIAGWTIDAETKQVSDPVAVHAIGENRAQALGVVADAWRAHSGASGYPPFDWGAIREALTAVRAL